MTATDNEYQRAVTAARETRKELEYARDVAADSQRQLRAAEDAWLAACDAVDAARRATSGDAP